MSSVSGRRELRLGELPMENWMSHLPCALWDIPLDHLAIPGQPPCDRTLHHDEAINNKSVNVCFQYTHDNVPTFIDE